MCVQDTLRRECTGCGGCMNICPTKAIKMEYNEDGFLVPFINRDICVKCGKCVSFCHSLKNCKYEVPERGFVAYNKAATASSSGGVFYTIASYFLNELSGIVVGCVIDEHYHVLHRCITDIGDLEAMQGSKYVQSDMRDVYMHVMAYLNSGRHVLFCGTPCQIAAVRKYAEKNADKLYCIDLVCHGVPSPVEWEGHCKELEQKYGEKLKKIRFRGKSIFESNEFSLYFEINNKKKKIRFYQDSFYNRFINNINLRPKCYSCEYANQKRCGDLTIGDCGTTNAYISFHKGNTVSMCLINSEKGMWLWDNCCRPTMKYTELNVEKEVDTNKQLSSPTERDKVPVNRKKMIISDFLRMVFPTKVRVLIKILIRKY